jgi:hypothetical protein
VGIVGDEELLSTGIGLVHVRRGVELEKPHDALPSIRLFFRGYTVDILI